MIKSIWVGIITHLNLGS